MSIEKFTGETPHIEAAITELGFHVSPHTVASLAPFRRAANLIVQALLAPPENQKAIALEAAKDANVFAVADLAMRTMLAHGFEEMGLTLPEDASVDLPRGGKDKAKRAKMPGIQYDVIPPPSTSQPIPKPAPVVIVNPPSTPVKP